PLFAVAASPDGERFLFGDDRGVVLHKDRQRAAVARLSLARNPVIAIGHLSDGWVVGQANGTISLLDQDATTVLSQIEVTGPVWDLDCGPDGVVVAGRHVSVCALDVARKALRLTGEQYAAPATDDFATQTFHAARFSPDGTQILAADDRGHLMTWH